MFHNQTSFSDGDALGQVVDVMDPKKLGRVRVKVAGVHDNVPNDMIPWARPKVMSNGGTQSINVPKFGSAVYVNMSDPHEPSFSGNAILDGKLHAELATNYPYRSGYVTESGTVHYADEQTMETKTTYSSGVVATVSGAGAVTMLAPSPITHEVEGGAKIVMSQSGTTVTADATFQNNTTTQGNTQVQGNSSVGGNMGVQGSASIGGNAQIAGGMHAATGTIGGKPINTDKPLSKASLKEILGYVPLGIMGMDTNGGALTKEQVKQLFGEAATSNIYGDNPLSGSEDIKQIIDQVGQAAGVLTPITVKVSAPTFVYQDGSALPPVQVIDIWASVIDVDIDSLTWTTTPGVSLMDTTKIIKVIPDSDSVPDPGDVDPPNDPDVGKPGGDNPYDLPDAVEVEVNDPAHKRVTVTAFGALDVLKITVQGAMISKVGIEGTPRIVEGYAVITRDDNLSPTLREQIEAVAGELVDVIDEYGSLAALIDAAELAAANALLAKNLADAAVVLAEAEAQNALDAAILAGGYATTSSTARDEAQGWASAAAASALIASTAGSATGLTSNPQFTNGVSGWVDAINVNVGYTTATQLVPVTNYQGDDAVIQNATGTTLHARGKVTTYVLNRKYRLRGRFYTAGVAGRVTFGCVGFNGAGTYVATRDLVDYNPATLNNWTNFNILLDMTTWDGYGYAQFAPYATTNVGAVAGHSISLGHLYLEDVTESEDAKAAALASNTSAGAAFASANDSGNYAAAAQQSALNATSQAVGRAVTVNSQFTLDVAGWYDYYQGVTDDPTILAYHPSWNGASHVLVNATAAPLSMRSSLVPFNNTRRYRIRGRWRSNTTLANIHFGVTKYDAAGAYVSYLTLVSPVPVADTWTDLNFLINNATHLADGAQFRVFAATNWNSDAGTVHGIDSLWIEDVTESELATEAAGASANSATTAGTHSTNAGNYAAAAQTSELKAAARSNTRGLTSNADFISGIVDWVDTYISNAFTYLTPSALTPKTNFQGAAFVASNTSNARLDTRGSAANVQTARKYRLKGRYWNTTTTALIMGVSAHSATGSWSSSHNLYFENTPAATWVEVDQEITPSIYASFPVLTPYVITNYTAGGAPTAADVAVDYLFIEDVTESWTANAQAIISSNAATTATNQVSLATTQANLSATFATDSRLHAANPDQGGTAFERDGAYYFNGYQGAPNSITPLPSPFSGGVFVTVSGVGRVAQVNTGASYDISSIGVYTIQPGRKYRASVRHRTLTGTRPLVLYSLTVNDVYTYVNTFASGQTASVTSNTTWTTTTTTIDGTAAIAGGATYIRVMIRADASANAVQYSMLKIEDVTESVESAAQASISGAQAVLADGYRSAAAIQSNLAATYRADTARINGNFGFELGLDNWYEGFEHSTGNMSAPLSANPTRFSIVTGASTYWDKDLVVTPGTNRTIYNGTMIPINTARKYRIRAQYASWAPNPPQDNTFYIGFVGLDSQGVYVNHGGYGTYRYCTVTGTTIGSSQYFSPSVIVTGEGNDSWYKFPPGTKFIRLMAITNYLNNPNTNSYIGGIWCEDVTDSEAAASSADIAISQSVLATNAAAAAQTSALLSASLGKGYINPNANFAAWGGAIGAITEYPLGWANWSLGAGTHRKLDMANMGLATNQRPEGSEWVYSPIVPSAGESVGLLSVPTEMAAGPGSYTIEATAQLMDGSFSGSGILVYMFNSALSVIQTVTIAFNTDPDTAGVVGGNFVMRKWSKNFTAIAGTTSIRVYAMGNWPGGLIGAGIAKVLAFYNVGLMKGNATDATVATHASVLATHDLKLASYVTKVTAGSGTAELALVATDIGGSPASTITLRADKIRLGGLAVPALEIVGGVSTFTGELNVGGTSGARVNITKNLILVYDASNVMRVRIGVWT